MITIKNSFLVGKRHYLRILEYVDIGERYLSWMTDPEVTRYLAPIGQVHTLETLQKYWRQNQKENVKFLAIIDKNNDAHIGNVRFEIYDVSAGVAELGMIIGEKTYWGKSCMYDVYGMLIKYAFEELGLQKVTLGAEADHVASIITFKKLGFQVEKWAKNAYSKNERTVECIHFQLPLEDYLKNKTSNLLSMS